MTLCNMSIEAGARAGMIAPDQTTFDYLRGPPLQPQSGLTGNARSPNGEPSLLTDDGAQFDRELVLRAEDLAPFVTWGTSPGMVVQVTDRVPDPAASHSVSRAPRLGTRHWNTWRSSPAKPLKTWPSIASSSVPAPTPALKTCVLPPKVVSGYHVHAQVRALVVPGSQQVKLQAEHEGWTKYSAVSRL